MAGERTSDVGSALAPLKIGPYGAAWFLTRLGWIWFGWVGVR